MAYVNIAEWTPEHVGEWLKGLDDAILPYIHFFLNNNIDGRHLLTLSPDDLTHLHITKVGHQELILEAITLLRLLHYNLTSENLQCLALKLGCKARSLYNELKRNGPVEDNGTGKQERVSTLILSSVSDILLAVKSFISWLDRYPFEGKDQYNPIRKSILKLSIELASTAQRDQFVEKPHIVIKNSCLNLADLCDKIVQEFNDSLIIQPASLDVATVKKKPEEELGIHLHSSYSGIHVVGGVKFQSPAYRCGKVEIGDEIIQVNYQTVVGWQLKKLVYAMREHPAEAYLTLKKRPRHTNILGQVIILKPYRIPSKKTAFGKVHKWSEGNSSLHIQEYPSTNSEQPSTPQDVADDDDDDSAFLPDYVTPADEPVINSIHYQILPAKTRATVQRRATVSGASPTVKHAPVSIEDLMLGTKLWKKDIIGRSISHDPSKHITSECSLNSQRLDTIKSNGSEDSCDKIADIESDQNMTNGCNNSELHERLTNSGSPVPSLSICGDGSLKVSNIVIPLHEEEYTILENKSLGKFGNSTADKESVKEMSSDDKAIQRTKNNESQSPEGKKIQLTGPWEGQDMVFFGRRPSAHELDNEIAGSSTTDEPVLMKVAPLIATSLLDEDDRTEGVYGETYVNGMKSYQVTIVGGVAQKCSSPSREIKKSVQSPLLRKRSNVTGKFTNRRISCKDLGKGDCHGWLYKRKEHKTFLSGARWTKRWVVLKNHHLFSYHDKDDRRAECLIHLPGFTVSPATECKSKKHAFKLHHPGTTFYFATDSQEDMTKWMNKMGLAAISYKSSSSRTTDGLFKCDKGGNPENNAYYSETEDESEDNSPAGSRYLLSRESSPSSVSSGTSGMFKVSDFYEHLEVDTPHCSLSSLNNYPSADGGRQPVGQHQGNQMRSLYNRLSKHAIGSHKKYDISQFEKAEEMKYMPNFRMGYVRSLSCTDATSPYMHHLQYSDKYVHHIPSGLQFPRKMSYQEVSSGTTFGNEEKYTNIKSHRLSGQWSGNEEKMQDVFTGSLGRQRAMVKEITPGLVARMTGSYNNLSQKQTQNVSTERRKSKEQTAPTPGYVAKLSGSFDQLAKSGWKSPSKIPPDGSTGKENVEYNAGNNRNCNPEELDVKEDNNSGKFLSMLDKEYLRLYGKRKPSTISFQSGTVDKQPPKTSTRIPQQEKTLLGVASQTTKTSFPNYSTEVYPKPYDGQNLSSQKQRQTPLVNKTYEKDSITQLKSSLPCENTAPKVYNTNPQYFKFDHVDLIQGSKVLTEDNSKLADLPSEASLNNSGQRRPSKDSFVECVNQSTSKSAFKFFGSPKFMKKFTSPKPEKKHNFKNKFKSESKFGSPISERKFLGSPKLARAIFGSPKVEHRTVMTTSAAVQTENIKDVIRTDKNNDHSCLPQNQPELNDECLKTSSNSSLNSSASSSAISSTGSSHYYVETRIRPQITISLPLVTESNNDDRPPTPETPRTPKPTMGIAMIGKRRTSSVSNEGNRTANSMKSPEQSKDDIQYERNEVTFDINKDVETDDEMVELYKVLRQAELTVDGVNVRARRCRTLFKERGVSAIMRSLFALQRTLKDRENELEAIDRLLRGTISSKELELWASQYPHYMPPEYC